MNGGVWKRTLVGIPWCSLHREITRDRIKPGTFSCPDCRRGLKWKNIEYPDGTIPVQDERDETGGLTEHDLVRARKEIEMMDQGVIVVRDEKPVTPQTMEAITQGDLVALIRAHKRVEMEQKGYIVVRDEREAT